MWPFHRIRYWRSWAGEYNAQGPSWTSTVSLSAWPRTPKTCRGTGFEYKSPCAQHLSRGPMPSVHRSQLTILIPVYNDWEAVSLLLEQLDPTLAASELRAGILLVDDGSTTPPPPHLGTGPYRALDTVDLLALRRNVGHQRAIGIGLAFVADTVQTEAVLIMDGDGEDSPRDVPRLVERMRQCDGKVVVFAERRKRSESLTFRGFYGLYRLAHVLLTGIPVRVGNFSILPASQLQRIVVVSELWNHYAAAVFKARLPRDTIPTTRAKRLSGRSTMNLVSLVGHGLSALSVHAELIGVRLLVVALAGAAALLGVLAAVIGVRILTPLAIPGWATAASGLLLVLLSQAIAFAVVFVFLILHGRSQPSFIPIRDYHHFVSTVSRLFAGTIETDRTSRTSVAVRPA